MRRQDLKLWEDEKRGIIEENARTQDKLKVQVAALNETLKEKEKREFIKINIGLSMMRHKSRLTKR